jgi:formiminotetrahydrofolate cyclodeaminase
MSDWKQAAGVLGEAFSNTDATPGGGSAAGIAGAIGCALARMAAGISAKSKSKKMDDARRSALESALADFEAEQKEFDRLTGEDAAAFDAFMGVYAMAKDDPERSEKMRAALIRAGEVPLETAGKAAEVLEKLETVKTKTVGTVTSDVNCAIHLIRAAGLCALENVEINAASLKDEAAAKRLRDAAARVRDDLAGG